jgi:Flp pilus assembly protein protease CpaA
MNEISHLFSDFAIAILGCVLLFASATDLVAHRIPNALLAPALAIALLIAMTAEGVTGLISAIIGLVIGTLMLLPMYVAGGTSAGDAKLLGIAGAFLGPSGALFAGLFTFIAGAVIGLACIAIRLLPPILQCRLAELSIPLFNGLATHGKSSNESGRSIAYAPAIMIGSMTAAWYEGWTFLGI